MKVPHVLIDGFFFSEKYRLDYLCITQSTVKAFSMSKQQQETYFK